MTAKILLTASLLLVATLAAAAEPGQAPAGLEPAEALRADLLAYVDELSAVPPAVLGHVFEEAVSFPEARERIAGMSKRELLELGAALRHVPYWRALPGLLASAPAATPAAAGPAQLAGSLEAVGARVGTETLRRQILHFVGSLRGVPAELVSAEYHARLDRVETIVRGLDGGELVTLQGAMLDRAPVWSEALEGARAPGPAPGGTRLEARSHAAKCSGGFPGNVICEIEHVLQEIVAIPGKVAQFAEDAFNAIVNGLKNLFGTLTDALNPAEIFSLAGLDDAEWFNDVLASVPILRPPCPAPGTNVPTIGEMGDLRATLVCQRGLEWVAGAIYDLLPDDVWGLPAKLPGAIFFYPVNYLCLCFEEAHQLADAAAHETHFDLVEDRLDVTVSSRASQANLNLAQGQVDQLDDDVAVIEAKADVLEAKADTLLIEQGEMSAFLLEFQELALRLRIEANLFRDANHRVSLFQLPESVGGFIEVVRQIVEESIQSREDAGGNVRNARRELAKGDDEYVAGRFKSAFTHFRRAYQAAR